MSRNVNIPALVNCPKCGAGRTIAQYRHVEGGICFLCNGDGKVTAAQAAGWERELQREAVWAMRAVSTETTPARPPTKRKVVDLGMPWMTNTSIVKCEDVANTFCLACVIKGDYYAVYFEVKAGRVVIGDVQYGVEPYKAQILKALQAALKV
jgi:hypothetical protein